MTIQCGISSDPPDQRETHELIHFVTKEEKEKKKSVVWIGSAQY